MTLASARQSEELKAYFEKSEENAKWKADVFPVFSTVVPLLV